jgi:hypothetical protein
MDYLPKLPESATHAQLVALRDRYEGNRAMQNALSPAEHRAFAREWVRERPWLGTLSLGVGIPVYSGAKALLHLLGRKRWSDPSMAEITQGYAGILEGLRNR